MDEMGKSAQESIAAPPGDAGPRTEPLTMTATVEGLLRGQVRNDWNLAADDAAALFAEIDALRRQLAEREAEGRRMRVQYIGALSLMARITSQVVERFDEGEHGYPLDRAYMDALALMPGFDYERTRNRIWFERSRLAARPAGEETGHG